jgi:hypothetical protein
MKLLFACPTYGPIDPEAAASQRAAIMHAATRGGVTWVGDLAPDRMKFDEGRNTIVRAALETDADAIFWCDSDVLLHPVDAQSRPTGPADAITRLVQHGKDFVTGVLCQRQPPYFPLIAKFDAERAVFNWATGMPRHVVAPVDGCGFGCVLTSLALVRALPAPWFAFEHFSEDFDFCLKAQAAGFQLYADTSVLCTHLGDRQRVRLEDFEALRDGGGLTDGQFRSGSAA